jgi:hypothetical protein
MRVVDGDHDGFFGSNPDGVRSQLELATSYNCAGWNCIQPDGSGWYMVQGSELQDGNADHCYFYSNANSTCSSFTNIDPGWDTGASVWEKNPDLDWLVSHATP